MSVERTEAIMKAYWEQGAMSVVADDVVDTDMATGEAIICLLSAQANASASGACTLEIPAHSK